MPRRIVDLTVEHVRAVSVTLAEKLMTWDEPIPDFATRFSNVLESCLLTPLQTFNRKPLYPTLIKRAAILFYLFIKNHPFQNGNKRIAVTSLLVFLWLNNYWLRTDPTKLYRFALMVAQSDPELKDGVVSLIELYLKRNLVKLEAG